VDEIDVRAHALATVRRPPEEALLERGEALVDVPLRFAGEVVERVGAVQAAGVDVNRLLPAAAQQVVHRCAQ
jgi:hypothetical protein